MSRKYADLTAYLEQQSGGHVTLTFADVEKIVGFPLPSSARKHGPWWTNSPSKGRHNEAWLAIGWETTDRNMKGQTITFQRSGAAPTDAGKIERPAKTPRAAKAVFDPASLTETDLAADCAVALNLNWRRLGAVTLSDTGKLTFPAAPTEAGLYRLIVRTGNRTNVYVGEAVNLKRRFGNYRLPGNTQQTSLRINALLHEALGGSGAIFVDIAYQDIGLTIGGVLVEADLADKAVRRMIEQAAIVAHGGIDVEMLNR
ncbi:hypothetical protein KRZ98_05305 [Sphingobium sp. AS12]|uniref:DUF7662 domain-containing protein n=1 Tax=Sphingobium sp. AS12 TaxID=2849495 RepID=UPI001C3149F4|nr:hypothetical protein [Sphingobium sp. AS12]MBV2147703.1 hypothetical protein [Sphingobium sp. AS12]